MRIDKWLWCVRIFKTRTDATESCKAGLIKIDGRRLKPSSEVQPGDELEVTKEGFHRKFKVLNLLEKRVGAKLVPDYLEELTTPEEIEKQKAQQDIFRERGSGRPTKKDRRELDKYFS
jgi:ribosome-associated heat shock protein Hsp15